LRVCRWLVVDGKQELEWAAKWVAKSVAEREPELKRAAGSGWGLELGRADRR
jgi:hypothetical protein